MKRIFIVLIVITICLVGRFALQKIFLTTDSKLLQLEQFNPSNPEEHILFAKKIDINSAQHDYLTILPGIGPKLARRIIDRRREIGGFSLLKDLLSVPGIGPAKFAKIRQYIDAK